MIDLDTSLGEKLLEVAVRQAEARVPAHRQQGDPRRDRKPAKANERCWIGGQERRRYIPAASPSLRGQAQRNGADARPEEWSAASTCERRRAINRNSSNGHWRCRRTARLSPWSEADRRRLLSGLLGFQISRDRSRRRWSRLLRDGLGRQVNGDRDFLGVRSTFTDGERSNRWTAADRAYKSKNDKRLSLSFNHGKSLQPVTRLVFVVERTVLTGVPQPLS